MFKSGNQRNFIMASLIQKENRVYIGQEVRNDPFRTSCLFACGRCRDCPFESRTDRRHACGLMKAQMQLTIIVLVQSDCCTFTAGVSRAVHFTVVRIDLDRLDVSDGVGFIIK